MTVIVSIVPQESTWDGATYDSDWSGTDEIVTITVMQPNGVPRDYDIDDCITIEVSFGNNVYPLSADMISRPQKLALRRGLDILKTCIISARGMVKPSRKTHGYMLLAETSSTCG
jgi:hypothetical protein